MTWLREAGGQFLLAFILALALWVFVTLSTNPDDTASYSNIPVEVQGVEPAMVIVGDEGLSRANQAELSAVTINVEADQATLSDFGTSNLQAFIDLSELGPGVHTVEVNAQSNRRNVRILSIEPDTLPVRLERIITQTIPLTIELQGTLPFSFERDEPLISVSNRPVDMVQVSGPQSQVERVVMAANRTINLDQLRATYIASLPLQAYDANDDIVEGVTITPSTVDVTIPVRSVVGVKRVPVVGNVVGAPALGYVVTGIRSDPSLINLVGSSRLLDQIERIETEPIDISDATSTITREVRLRFIGAQPQDEEQRTATVTVQIESLEQPVRVQVRIPVQVNGVDEALRINISTRFVEVSLEGSPQNLLQIPFDELTARIDATELSPGTYNITPNVTLPESIRLVGDIPQVRIDLTLPPAPEPAPTIAPTPVPAYPVPNDPTPDAPAPNEPAPDEPPIDTDLPTSNSRIKDLVMRIRYNNLLAHAWQTR